jgi:hypothetical protein
LENNKNNIEIISENFNTVYDDFYELYSEWINKGIPEKMLMIMIVGFAVDLVTKKHTNDDALSIFYRTINDSTDYDC